MNFGSAFDDLSGDLPFDGIADVTQLEPQCRGYGKGAEPFG